MPAKKEWEHPGESVTEHTPGPREGGRRRRESKRQEEERRSREPPVVATSLGCPYLIIRGHMAISSILLHYFPPYVPLDKVHPVPLAMPCPIL